MELRTVCLLIALSLLGCKEDSATLPSDPSDHIDLPGAVLRGTLDEQRAAAGVSGLRGSREPALTGATTTLLDSTVSSSSVTRTSSASFVLVSNLRMEVK